MVRIGLDVVQQGVNNVLEVLFPEYGVYTGVCYFVFPVAKRCKFHLTDREGHLLRGLAFLDQSNDFAALQFFPNHLDYSCIQML